MKNSTPDHSSDWMMIIAALLMASLIGAVVSPRQSVDTPQTAMQTIRDAVAV